MKTVLIVVGVIIVLCLCAFIAIIGLGLAGGLGLTQPVADVGEKFMQSLKTGDYDTAYALCHPSLQEQFGSAQGLKQMVAEGQAQPVKWSFNSRNIENDQGHMEGTVTMKGGEGTVTIDLVKAGSEWKVIGFDLKPK
ncbi:MAG: DUF4864 domain-containing protein [Chloroflexi bacterium]|nr:DUF4864 domain-containing protein [Chloroflexota bacterium]